MNDYVLNATSTKVTKPTNRVNSKGKVIQLPADYKNDYVLIWNNGSEVKAFCQSDHKELTVQQLSFQAVQFSEVEDGAGVLIDGIRYRKTRPWAPQQYNASLVDDGVDYEAYEPFIKVEGNKEVGLLLSYDNLHAKLIKSLAALWK